MVWLDVGDQGDCRAEIEKPAVIFVGLGDEVTALPPVPACWQVNRLAPDHIAGVEAGIGEQPGNQRRRRCLAVRAGNADADLAGHQSAQQLAAFDHRDAGGPRRLHLDVV